MLFSCNASHSGTSMPAGRQSSFCNSFDFFVRSARLQAIQAPCFSRSCVTDLLLRYSSAGCFIRFVARVVPAQHTSYIYIMLSVKICAVRETAAIMYLLQLLCFHYPALTVIVQSPWPLWVEFSEIFFKKPTAASQSSVFLCCCGRRW